MIATLPKKTTLPSIATLPRTATLSSIAMLPRTAMLLSIATLLRTTTLLKKLTVRILTVGTLTVRTATVRILAIDRDLTLLDRRVSGPTATTANKTSFTATAQPTTESISFGH